MPKLNVPPDSEAPEYQSPVDAKLQEQAGASTKEKAFYHVQRLRRYGMLALVLVLACGPFLWIGSQLATKKPTPTPTPLNPVEIVTAVAGKSVQSARPPAFLDCYALVDIDLGDRYVPVQSKVSVSGFTFARGGLVSIGGRWVNQGFVRCDGDLRSVESAYFPTVTPTVFPTATVLVVPSATQTPVYIRVVPSPYPTYTPYPTSAVGPVDINGAYFDVSGCLVVSLWNVKAIYVNNAPAVGGQRYCDVRSFRVEVK